MKAVSQSAAQGAWPVLMAATADLPGATYVGPGGLGEVAGHPQVVTSTALSNDEDAQRRLWELSQETTGMSYPSLPPSPPSQQRDDPVEHLSGGLVVGAELLLEHPLQMAQVPVAGAGERLALQRCR